MKLILASCLLLFIPTQSFAERFTYLNTGIFGKSTFDKITVFEKVNEPSIKPEGVFLDSDKNYYYAATVTYSEEVAFNTLYTFLSERYSKFEIKNLKSNSFAIWRVVDKKFALSLVFDDEEGLCRLIYVQFTGEWK